MPQQRISLRSGIISTMGGRYRHLLSDKRLVSPFYSYGFRKLSLGHMTEQQFADGSRACYQLSASTYLSNVAEFRLHSWYNVTAGLLHQYLSKLISLSFMFQTLLSAFAKFRKATNYLRHVCLSAWNNMASNVRIFTKFGI